MSVADARVRRRVRPACGQRAGTRRRPSDRRGGQGSLAREGTRRGGGGAGRRFVTIEHVKEATAQLRGTSVVRALAVTPVHQQLMLAAFVLLQGATGRVELEADLLVQRHEAMCKKLTGQRITLPSEAEQREAIARLCSSRFLAPGAQGSQGSGALRLLVQPDDVKAMAREQPLSAELFPSL